MEIDPPTPDPSIPLPLPPPPPPPPPPQPEQPNPKRQKMSTTTTSDDDQNTENAPRRPKYRRRSIAIFFAYCGVGYQGMQKNPGAKTIEGDLEEALYLSGAVPEEERGKHKRYDWARSARTDKGVSAVGQVVSGKFFIDPPGFIERLQSNLSPQIRIFGYKRATPTFNAKKFCDRRRYVYLIPVFALDPTCHRDRESVMASVGSGSELVKCLECSERGRKVFGVMGRSGFERVVQGGRAEIVSCNSSNGGSALEEVAVVEKDVTETGDDDSNNTIAKVVSGNSSNSECALVDVTNSENGNSKNNDAEGNNSVIETGMKLDTGVGAGEKMEEDNVVAKGADGNYTISETGVVLENGAVANENGDGNAEVEKKSEFCYGDEVKERFNRILKYYVGTHNFHNFTTRTKAEDPAAKRYILSFNANTVVNVDGIDFVKCEVVGQSFMLHQIRKMIGLAVAIMRNYAPEALIEAAFEQKLRITVPMAPEVGLYLDECFFPSYNKKWKDTHEELSMKAYEEEAEEFKLKYIYSHIASTEHKDGVVGLWLHSLNYRNYPDLRVLDKVDNSSELNANESVDNGPSPGVKVEITGNASDNVDNSAALESNESVVNGPSFQVKDDDTVNAPDNVDNSDLKSNELVDNAPTSEVKDDDTVNAAQ